MLFHNSARKDTKNFSNQPIFLQNISKKVHFSEKITYFCYFLLIFFVFSKIFCTFASRMSEVSINIKGKLLSLTRPKVMAIVNATTDSFAFSCTNISEAEVLSVAAKAVAEGADIIDVGACSTRPGSEPVSEAEEWRRLSIALKAIRGAYPNAVVSVDTFRAEIARRAVTEFGADIINDISGGADEHMFATIAELGVPYILTHNRESQNEDIIAELIDFFVQKADELHRLGVKDVILDPGFGFSKTLEQNWHILANLKDLQMIQLPILVGLSRKSMIYKLLETTPQANNTLTGTIAAQTIALQNGASILRVHDVKEAKETIKIWEQC